MIEIVVVVVLVLCKRKCKSIVRQRLAVEVTWPPILLGRLLNIPLLGWALKEFRIVEIVQSGLK